MTIFTILQFRYTVVFRKFRIIPAKKTDLNNPTIDEVREDCFELLFSDTTSTGG